MSTTGTALSVDTYLQEFARWVAVPARRPELRAELEAHLREAEAAGRLDEAIEGLGSPRDAARAFTTGRELVVSRRLRRLTGAILDYGISFSPWVVYAAVLIRGDRLGPEPVAGPSVCFPPWGCAPMNLIDVLMLAGCLFWFAVVLTLLEWRYGRTPGKLLAGTRVVSEDGTSIDIGQAVLRRLPLVFSGFLQIIDWAFALFGPRYQRAFDRIARTLVVIDARSPRGS